MQYTTDKEKELSDALQNMVRVLCRPYTVFEGTVLSTDEDTYTCSVKVGDSQSSVTFENVSLEAITGSPVSFILIPNDNTECLLCFRDGCDQRPQILKINSVKKIIANATSLFQFNDGTNGGLVLVNKEVARLNKIEQDINALKQVFTSWVVAPNDGGAALKTAAATWFGQPLVETVPDDVQSKVITQ